MKHTKLPWSYGGVNYNDWGGKYVSILEPNGVDEVVGENSLDIEDAAFIVTAVNSHEMLVEALKKLTGHNLPAAYDSDEDDAGHCPYCSGWNMRHKEGCEVVNAEKALAQLEE